MESRFTYAYFQTQHRMVRPIAGVISRLFYQGRLRSHSNVDSHTLDEDERFPFYDPLRSIIFYHTEGLKEEVDRSI